MSSIGTCYIWGFPDICREFKYAIARGETEPDNLAMSRHLSRVGHLPVS